MRDGADTLSGLLCRCQILLRTTPGSKIYHKGHGSLERRMSQMSKSSHYYPGDGNASDADSEFDETNRAIEAWQEKKRADLHDGDRGQNGAMHGSHNALEGSSTLYSTDINSSEGKVEHGSDEKTYAVFEEYTNSVYDQFMGGEGAYDEPVAMYDDAPVRSPRKLSWSGLAMKHGMVSSTNSAADPGEDTYLTTYGADGPTTSNGTYDEPTYDEPAVKLPRKLSWSGLAIKHGMVSSTNSAADREEDTYLTTYGADAASTFGGNAGNEADDDDEDDADGTDEYMQLGSPERMASVKSSASFDMAAASFKSSKATSLLKLSKTGLKTAANVAIATRRVTNAYSGAAEVAFADFGSSRSPDDNEFGAVISDLQVCVRARPDADAFGHCNE